jgi:hypothetical protein
MIRSPFVEVQLRTWLGGLGWAISWDNFRIPNVVGDQVSYPEEYSSS